MQLSHFCSLTMKFPSVDITTQMSGLINHIRIAGHVSKEKENMVCYRRQEGAWSEFSRIYDQTALLSPQVIECHVWIPHTLTSERWRLSVSGRCAYQISVNVWLTLNVFSVNNYQRTNNNHIDMIVKVKQYSYL